jgi:hypothetical protein
VRQSGDWEEEASSESAVHADPHSESRERVFASVCENLFRSRWSLHSVFTCVIPFDSSQLVR